MYIKDLLALYEVLNFQVQGTQAVRCCHRRNLSQMATTQHDVFSHLESAVDLLTFVLDSEMSAAFIISSCLFNLQLNS